MTDPVTFHQFLSNVALWLSRTEASNHRIMYESMKHHSIAIRSLNQRIGNIQPKNAIGTISAILAVAVHANLCNDHRVVEIHLGAVTEIINRYCSPNSITIPGQLQLLMFWSDMLICSQNDRYPHFPIPVDALHLSRNQPLNSDAFRVLITDDSDRLGRALSQLVSFGELCKQRLQPRYQSRYDRGQPTDYSRAVLTTLYIHPILHQLLSLRPQEVNENSPIVMMREVTRIGAMVALVAVRRKIIFMRTSNVHQIHRIYHLLLQFSSVAAVGMEDLALFEPVKLWLLILAGMEASTTEQKEWFKQQLVTTALNMSLSIWIQVQAVLANFFWVSAVHDAGGRAFWMEATASTRLERS